MYFELVITRFKVIGLRPSLLILSYLPFCIGFRVGLTAGRRSPLFRTHGFENLNNLMSYIIPIGTSLSNTPPTNSNNSSAISHNESNNSTRSN